MVLPTRRAVVLAGAVMVRAQESNRTFRLGMLVGAPRHAPQLAAFFDELGKAGFIEGNNLRIDFRVQGSLEQSASSVAELMQPAPDVLVTGAPTIAEVQAVTRTVPILGVFDDMVAIGLIPSLARPGKPYRHQHSGERTRRQKAGNPDGAGASFPSYGGARRSQHEKVGCGGSVAN